MMIFSERIKVEVMKDSTGNVLVLADVAKLTEAQRDNVFLAMPIFQAAIETAAFEVFVQGDSIVLERPAPKAVKQPFGTDTMKIDTEEGAIIFPSEEGS